MTWTQKLFSFQGRMRRQDYWVIVLTMMGAIMVGMMVLVGIVAMVGSLSPDAVATTGDETFGPAEAAITLTIVALLIPVYWVQIATCVKRLHDQDLTGWLYLLVIVPLGGFALFILCGFIDGTKGPNKFGPSPKGLGVQTEADRVFG